MQPCDLLAASLRLLHRRLDRAPGGAPADDQQIGVFVALDLCERDVLGDAGDLRSTEHDHALVVVGVVADVARPVLLLDAADAMHEAGRAGNGPRTSEGLRVAQERPELGGAVVTRVVVLGGECDRNVGQILDVREPPRLGAVGQVAVGEQDHGRAVLQRDSGRLDRGVEAVRRAVSGDDRDRRFAVPTVQGEE